MCTGVHGHARTCTHMHGACTGRARGVHGACTGARACTGRARACTGVHGACMGRARACPGRARACTGVHGACMGVLGVSVRPFLRDASQSVCLSSEQFPAPPDPIPRKGILL